MSTRRSEPPDEALSSALRVVEEHLADAPIDVRVAWHCVVGRVLPRPKRITQPFERVVVASEPRPFVRPIPREEPE